MDELITQSLTFPAVFFSLGLVLAVAYWLLVVLGAVDAHHGHGHGAHGGHGAHDVAHNHPHGDGLLDTLGLGGVPVMLPLSFIFLFGWAATVLAQHFIPALAGGGVLGALLGVGVLLGSTIAVTPLVRVAVIPFRRLFQTHTAVSRHALVGRRCVVTSQRVTSTSGQAEIDDYGAGHLVEVRCAEPNPLTKGADAVVFDYDTARDLFFIAPLDTAQSALARTGATE